MIDISRLSRQFKVRELIEDDIDAILKVYKENDLFFQYCKASPTKAQVLDDMLLTPPGMNRSSKYYVGFYSDNELIAIMDLIDGYPKPEIAYIGLFMINMAFQGKQIGSAIIHETEEYLNSIGIKKIRLAINNGNPQSSHFWKKNGYVIIREVDKEGWGKLLEAEKSI